MKRNSKSTSWEKVSPWYNKITRNSGHYYHEHVVIPGVLKLLNLKPGDKLLDLASGTGVLGRAVPKGTEYLGVDIAPSLVAEAKKNDRNFSHTYQVGDATETLSIPSNFSHAAIILALQNIKEPASAIKNISDHLNAGGTLVLVLNHPAFRIPRQSSWEIDEGKKTQYRRVDRYMSPLEIPIHMNPSDRNSQMTMSYHFPVSSYSKMLKENGFVIDLIEEWTSDKESVGKASKMENRSRNEIPLFMAILAKKTA